MDYSKITSVEVFNFMAYPHAIIHFDEQNIINLKGYNSSGKSTLERAVAVCLVNAYPRDQIKFIKHGTDYFRVIVRFDDEVLIVRDKYSNGQSLYEMYKGKKCIYTSKQGSKLTKVDCVPTIIEDYLGLLETEMGCINYQTREDPLYLVETKGSENYYSLNEVLKTEEIARANTLLNSDKNKLSGEITEIEADLQQATLMLANYSSISEELIVALSEREVLAQSKVTRFNELSRLSETVSSIMNLVELPEVKSIDTRRLKFISDIEKILVEKRNLVLYPEVVKLGSKRLLSIESIHSSSEELSSIDTDLLPIDLDVVDISKYSPLARLQSELKSLMTAITELNDLEKEQNSANAEKEQVLQEAGNQGIKFIVCDNCGTLMEVMG